MASDFFKEGEAMKRTIHATPAAISAALFLVAITVSTSVSDRSAGRPGGHRRYQGQVPSAPILGAPAANYALLAQGAAGLAPIPFQSTNTTRKTRLS